MTKHAPSGGADSARQFNAIYSIEFSRKNIVTGDSFKTLSRKPFIQAVLDRLYKCLIQEANP